MNTRLFVLVGACAIFMSSCRKKPVAIDPPATAKIKVEINNMVDGSPLVYNTVYKNALGEDFKITRYEYFISNISLIAADGSGYTETESYHLINHAVDSSKEFDLANVPEKEYKKIKFLIGVDSTRNTTGAQTGALDPLSGMFWSWNTGYIMAKLEGTSPQAQFTDLTFHMGGFGGEYNVLRWVTIDLPQALVVKNGSTRVLHLSSNVAEWFKNPGNISFAKMSLVNEPGKEALQIADNYADMFKVDHID